jgi:hypothetical protein
MRSRKRARQAITTSGANSRTARSSGFRQCGSLIALHNNNDRPGSAGIPACFAYGNDRLTEASRQGCLRSQVVCPAFF